MSHSEAEERRKAVRLLLATAELVKLPAQDLVYRNLVIVAFPTGDQSLFLCRGVITDIQPWTETVQVQVLLVDECQKDIIVSPDWIFVCPRSLSVYPTVIQQYILADILPAKKEWPPDVISYLRSRLVKKFVPVIRDIEDDKFGYISPLEPDGFGLPIVCRLINESWALPAVSFPGLITGVLEELQIEYPKLATLFLPFRKELTFGDHSIKSATYKTMPLPTNSYEECQISHCTVGPWKFYLQFKQQIESYKKLQGKLRLYFDTGKLEQGPLKIGSSVLCYIRNLKEEEYQRGLVTGEASNNEIPVYLVDKGATLKLRKDSLWELPVELLDTPICMIKCCLDGLPEVVDSEVSNAFGEVIHVHPLKCKVVKMDEGKLIKVSMLANGCDVLKMITPSFKRSQLAANCKVFVSYVCKSDDVIYVHLSRESLKLEDLQRKLQETSCSALVIEDPVVNMTCLARYEDGYWYRGIVLETGAYIKVKYVDYGNSALVSHGNVRELSLDLISKLPAQAIPCILSEVPMKAVTSALVEEFLGPIGESETYVKSIGSKKLKLESVTQEVAVVEMISEKGSLNRYLEEKLKKVVDTASSALSYTSHVIREDAARNNNPKSLPEFNPRMQTESLGSSESSNYYLNHNVQKMFMTQEVTSHQVNQFGVNRHPVVEVKPGTYGQVRLSYVGRACFFVTLLEEETNIQAMREILREKCQGALKNGIEGLKVGWLVASFDDSDHLWHRGLVTGCLGKLVELTLIDSGKDIVVEKLLLQELPDTPVVLSTPAQAIKCTLSDGSLKPGRLEHMKKEVGVCFLAHFCKEEDGLWEVQLYAEKVVGDGEKRGAENSSLMLGSERSGSTLSKEEPSKRSKGETTPECNVSVSSFLQELTRSSEIDTGNSTEKSGRKLEETKWETPNRQHKSASGPIRNKSHRYHATPASDRWRDGSNNTRTYDSQWKETKTSSTSSTQSEETSFEKPVRNQEFGLFRNRKHSTTQDTPLKTKSSHATMQNVVENTSNQPSRSFGEVKNQEKKFSWKPAKEMVRDKNCNIAEENSFMKKPVPSGDSWSGNQNSQNGNTKKIPSIPLAQVMCDNVFDAVITSIEDDGSFWIQASQQIPSLDKLMKDINESNADLLKVMTAIPEIGRPCLCVYAEDERYYRAVVKEFCNTDCAIVHYVDYGNSSEVKVCDMRLIPSRFLYLPCQAIHCYFSKVLGEKSLDVLHQNLEEILTEELKVSLTSELQDEDIFVIKSLTVKDVDLLSKIQKEQMNLETGSSGNNPLVNQIKENFNGCQIPYLKINYESEITAFICHVDTDGIIWVQLTANAVVLEEVMEKLNEIGSSSNRTFSPAVPGVPCLCQYSEDERFYRAEIKETLPTEGTAVVQYVDYGNVDHVQIKNLALLPEEFTTIPRQAICCSFRKDIRNKWSQYTQTHLEAFIEQECTLTLVKGSENEGENVIVRLAVGGVDILSHIASELEIDVSVRSETAEGNINILEASVPVLSLSYNSEITAYVSHVDNDSIWIQLSDQSTDLEEMEEKLSECALSPLTHAPEINCLYACRFADDGRLYRAVVREVDDKVGVTVHYIDHGNESHAELEHLYSLSSAFLSLPRQAIQCHFNKKKKEARPVTIQSLDELLNQELVLSLTESCEEDNRNILLSCMLDGKEVFSEQEQSLSVESNEKGEKLSDHEVRFENKIGSVTSAVTPVDDATLAYPSCLPVRFNETFRACVCHVERDSIWIQHADNLEDLEEIMKKLNESPPVTLHTNPVRDSLCVSQFSIDGMYYRCIVQEIDDMLSAVIHFIDYGNSEQVPVTDLYEIPDYCRSLPRQAVQCYFKKEMKQGDVQSLLNQVLEVSVHEEVKGEENIIVLDVCSYNGMNVLSDVLEVIPGVDQEKGIEEPDGILEQDKQELKEPNSIADETVETSRNIFESQKHIGDQCSVVTPRSSAGDDPDVTEIELEPTLVESNILGDFPVHQKEESDLCSATGLEILNVQERIFPKVSLELDKSFDAVISHFEKDGSLWVQVCDYLPAFSDMMEKLNEMSFNSSEHLEEPPVVGCMYACLCIKDSKFYRASLVSVSHESHPIVVQFVDYGIEATATVDNLRTLPECCYSTPVQAVRCYFSKTIRELWSESHQRQIEKMKTGAKVNVQVSVDDSDGGQLVFEEFQYANEDVLTLLHCNMSDQEVREVNIENLESNATARSLEKPETDVFDDEDSEKGPVTVNQDESPVTPELESTSAVQDTKGGDFHVGTELPSVFNEDNVQQFASKDMETVHVGDKVDVSNSCNELRTTPVNVERYGMRLKAVICHIENEGCLWLQLLDEFPTLHDMMTKLNELVESSLEPFAEGSVSVGSMCLCTYTTDRRLYRAYVKKLIDDENLVVVRYVDYGYEESVKMEELRKVPDCLENIPAQAVRCCFSKHIRENWSEYHNQLIIDIKSEVCVCVLSDDEGDGNLILQELHSEGRDIVRTMSLNLERNASLKVPFLDPLTVGIRDSAVEEIPAEEKTDSNISTELPSDSVHILPTYTEDDFHPSSTVKIEDTSIDFSLGNLKYQDEKTAAVAESGISEVTCKKLVLVPQNCIEYDVTFDAVVSHIESDGSLWLQASTHLPALSSMMKMLNELDIRSLELAEHALVGSVCLCPYTEDGRLYRVVVRELHGGDCPALVRYVDYGNEDFVKRDSLWKIPEDISQSVFHLPMQAIHCYPSKNIREYSCHVGIEDKVKVSLSLSEDGVNVLNKLIVQDMDVLLKSVGSLENQDCQGSAEIPSSTGDGLQHLVSLDSGETAAQENAVEVSVYQQQQTLTNDYDADETRTVQDTIEINLSEENGDENLIEFSSSNPTEDNCVSDVEMSQIFAIEPSPIMKENDRCINEHFDIDREQIDTDLKEGLGEVGVQSPLSGDGLSKVIANKNGEYVVDFREIPAENSSGETKHSEEISGRKDYVIEENEALKGRSVRNEDNIFVSTVPIEDPLLLEKSEQSELSFTEKSFDDLNLDLQNYANIHGQEHQFLLDSEEKPGDDYEIDILCTPLHKCMEMTEFECSCADKPNEEESLNEAYPDEQYLEFQAVAESLDSSHQSPKFDYDHCKQGTPSTNPVELIVEITGKTEMAEFILESEETCGILYSESPGIGIEYETDEEKNTHVIATANDMVQSPSEVTEIRLSEEPFFEHEESNCSFEKNEWEIQQQELNSFKYPDDDAIAQFIEAVGFSGEEDKSQEPTCFVEHDQYFEDEKINLKQTDDEVSGYVGEHTLVSSCMKDAESVYEQSELPCVEKSTSEEEQVTGGNISEGSDWNSADEINKMAVEVRLTSDVPDLQVSEANCDVRKAQQCAACVDGCIDKKHVELCTHNAETVDSDWMDTPSRDNAFSELQSHKTPEFLDPEPMKCLLECRLEPETSKDVLHDLQDKGKAFALQSSLVSGKEAFIMNVQAPGCLSLILKNDLGRLHNIQQCLHGSAEQLQLQKLKNIRPGNPCVVESEDGETRYRAIVLDVEEKNAKVYLVDEGKLETIPQGKLKQIPQNLLDPPCIYTCEVKPKNEQVVLSSDQIRSSIKPFIEKPLVLTAEDGKGKQKLTFQYCGKEVLEDFVCSVLMPVSQKPMVMDFPTCSGISESKIVPPVNVESVPRAKRSFDKSKSFLHIIDEEGEDSDETSVMQCYKALVVNVEENPFSLWVQKEEDFSHVTFIAKTLSSEGLEFEILQHPKKGQLCLCVLEDVKQRAKLISFDDNTALVHYIDLGKYDIVSRRELFELEEELTDIHPLASQVFLPVSIKKGMEGVSGSVIATAVLGQLCYCIDLRTQADRKIKTVVVSSGQGDLGKFLARMDLATGVSFDASVKDQISPLVNRFCQGHANEP